MAELVDLGGAWFEGVMNRIDFNAIASLNDFIESFTASGLLLAGNEVVYEDAGKTLTIPVAFSRDLAGLNGVPLQFDLDLGDLIGLTTTATANVTALVSGQIILIVDLDGPTGVEGFTLLVQDAQLTGDTQFLVEPLQISGRLGFVEITAGGAASNITMNGTATLSTTPSQAFSLSELNSDLTGHINFTFDGNAQATLIGLDIGGSFGGLSGDPDAVLSINIPSFSPLAPVEVTLPDLVDLLNLRNVNFATIINMLRSGFRPHSRSVSLNRARVLACFSDRFPGLMDG